jgi:pyruvate dehydrogenase E2 component (dihydrolipoamide acetyltransferase)
VGDPVERDEPLFEISTDKVDAEIPSPVAGVLTEIRAKEGETVPVNFVVAIIGAAGSKATAAPQPAAAPKKAESSPAAAAPSAPPPPSPSPQADGAPSTAPEGSDLRSGDQPAPSPAGEPRSPSKPDGGQGSVEDTLRQRSSPLVRKIAKEHSIDISQIRGTGIAGRVTKDDILAFITGAPAKSANAPAAPAAAAPSRPTAAPGGASGEGKSSLAGTSVPMSVMRKKIAEHMVLSRRTSAHVHSVFEVNFSRVAQVREAKKAEYERAGAKLTYLSFIVKAVVDALRAVPVINASVDGDNIVYHEQVSVGIAVALDWGLIVPVIKNADEKNLLGLSRAIADLANRARRKQLKPDEVSGGTFTITNPGVFGALFGMPIINQPQVAILGVGNVEKRPVVLDDAIAIRPMAYLSIGYDHRIVDGAVADEFMSHVKRTLEAWDPSAA